VCDEVVFDGQDIWVTLPDTAGLNEFRAADGTRLGYFGPLEQGGGYAPIGLTFDGANIWTANAIGNFISKM
jgi:hypothetical protein